MSDGTEAITLLTPRLRLGSATPALVSAELDGHDRLAAAVHAVVPPDWPPEHHDAETLRFWREELSQPGAAGWWLYYVLLQEAIPPILIGSMGYKGPPSDGAVEIGYSVVPSWQRRGLATEGSQALIEAAWQRGAEVVLAHTFERLEPSIGVLHKLGFQPAKSEQEVELEFRLRRQ
jgi:RimJ/RimL family protein N-acetyltransferase